MELNPIAIIGGTGHEGSGLALRWAAAGLDVIIGSRTKLNGPRRRSTRVWDGRPRAAWRTRLRPPRRP